MELVLAILIVFLISVIFGIGYLVGGKQVVNRIKKDGGYFDMEITQSVYPVLYPTSSLSDEVPTEFLMGGNIDKALHIAGVKEASIETQKEWAAERKQKVETETTLSMEDLLNSLNKEDLQLKAGIKQHTHNEEAIKVASKLISIEKDVNPLKEESLKIERARKEADRLIEEKSKSDFDALPMSRISSEARKKITEIVKKDIETQIKEIEANTPEITDEAEVKPKRKSKKNVKVK